MSGRIVRYPGLRGAVRVGPPMMDPRLRMGIGLARFAMANRGNIMKAAARVRRAWRGTRKRKAHMFKRTRIGEPVGAGTAKRHGKYLQWSPHDTRTQYFIDPIAIVRDTTTTMGIDQRKRDMINLRGFKMEWLIRNNQQKPLYVNIAVVAAKKRGTIGVDGFFRWTGNDRDINFSTALSSQQMSGLPINADEYTILLHKRFLMAPASASTNFNSTYPNFVRYRRYIKVNRQIRYEDNTDNTEQKINILYWCDVADALAASSAIPTAMTAACNVITYFKEPKT